MRRAAEAGGRVKAIGAGHSFTAAAVTDGVQVSLDRMSRVLDLDASSGRVRVEAGIRLPDLNEQLAGAGLAMPNLGDIDKQSIAGAIATATHGTGLGLGNLATTVVGMELVTGRGDVVRLDEASDPELLRVARVGRRCAGRRHRGDAAVRAGVRPARPRDDRGPRRRPGRAARRGRRRRPLRAVLDARRRQALPGQAQRPHRRGAPPAVPGRLRPRQVDRRERRVGGDRVRIGRRFPRDVPTVAKLVTGAAAERDVIDRSDSVFCTPRKVHFVEMEYGMPVEELAGAVRRLRDATSAMATPILFPIEVRVSAADDIPLSTGFGRPSGWIAVHQYRGAPYEEYFDVVERIMDDVGGRPHWGKLHGQRASTLAPRYPQWADFQAARDKLDPERTFANPYLDRVLG